MNELVEHAFYDVGHIIGYKSNTDSYQAAVGVHPTLVRLCKPDTLLPYHVIGKNEQLSLGFFV